MRKRLKGTLTTILPKHVLTQVYNSYDIIGDIAIIRQTETSRRYSKIIAETILKTHHGVKAVLAQTSPVHGNFRTRQLEHVAGQDKRETTHAESSCAFRVNVEKCYFSPRLSHERMRIAKLVQKGETVVNMFAGVGCFSIIIAKHSGPSKVYSIDINPSALQFMEQNVRLNRVYAKVIPILGDANQVITHRLQQKADRVLMPLPEKAFDYLPIALIALTNSGGWIHYYEFEHAQKGENPIEKTKHKVVQRLAQIGLGFEIPSGNIVRRTGPNWYQIALDIKVSSHTKPILTKHTEGTC